jgi:hypothetical protein
MLRAAAILAACCVTAVVSRAEPRDGAEPRAPVPEPLLSETVTDIDGSDTGEFELELNASELRSLSGGAFEDQASVEGEWLVTRRLGLRLEPVVSRGLEGRGAAANDAVKGGAGISWKVLQDFERDLYVQAEATGRVPLETSLVTDAGESALPFTFDLRAAARRGRWTFRGSFGAAAGGLGDHLPLRGSAAVLTGIASTERYGFWGVEADVDGARRNPVVLALNLVPHLGPLGIPFRLGLAIPWVVGAGDRPITGLFVRILFESAREYRYGTAGR